MPSFILPKRADCKSGSSDMTIVFLSGDIPLFTIVCIPDDGVGDNCGLSGAASSNTDRIGESFGDLSGLSNE